MVDSHAHLFFDGIYQDLDNILKSAKQSGVNYILTVSTDSKTIPLNISIAENHDNVCCSVGVHPHHFIDGYDLEELIILSKKTKVVAVGEIGLDYHYQDQTPKSDQIHLFRAMLSIATQCNLPYIIHSRECFDDIFCILSEYKIPSSVFHCYTDSVENAKKILDLGHFISFSGVITFKKSIDLLDVVRYVPDDRFLIETDCPYLAPVPHRGKPNEPAFVNLVAECIAEVRKTSVAHISKITTNNFFNLFQKAKFLWKEKYDAV
ncbi:MAG: TatD family hydrolase [Holosporales bacterium]|jgi:TatD DNase family protein|nr:TatD family hydrolase [Holosporales bacterium]